MAIELRDLVAEHRTLTDLSLTRETKLNKYYQLCLNIQAKISPQ